MANTQSSYISAANAFDNATGTEEHFSQGSANPRTLGQSVGTINGATTGLQLKQQQSTTGGCGTSFTTATDPANINVEQSLDGHVVKVETHNPETNETQIKVIKSDGSSFTMAEDGSIIFTTAKKDGDPKTGRFDVRSQGSTRFKIGESLLIEVENKNNVVADEKGGSSTAKAFSLVVYGNIDITSVGGEINAKAKNITVSADNELTLKAGSKISLLSGEGTGKNTPSGNQQAQKDYGGLVEIKCGDYYKECSTDRKNTSVNYNLVDAETGNLSTNKRAHIGFQSSGSFSITTQGDFHESIAGKKRTEIQCKIDPINTLFPGQSSAWLTQVTGLKSIGSGGSSTTPNAFYVTTDNGGMGFYSKKGDIDLATESGYWVLANRKTGVAGVDKAVPGYSNVTPGAYLTSKTDPLKMYVGSENKSGLIINAIKLSIKNPTGIYLN
jgi:hypothetical protein